MTSTNKTSGEDVNLTASDEVPAPRKRGRPREIDTIRPVQFEEVKSSWRRERPDVDLDNMLLMICLMRLGRIIDARYGRMCEAQFGITGPEMRVLLALRRSGRPFARRPTDLFRALLVTSSAVTKQVNRLTEKGLVARAPDPLHAGGYLVHLTPRGLKVVNQATDDLSLHSIIGEAMADLPEDQRAAGIRFCEYIIDRIED